MLAYRADIFLKVLFSGARILLCFLLWSAIYENTPLMGGYSLSMMITYVLFTTIFSQLQFQDGLAWELSAEVREGAFSKYLVRPMSANRFYWTRWIGAWAFQLVFSLASMLLWFLVYRNNLSLPEGEFLVWIIPFILMGAVFMILFSHLVALLSLKFQDVTGLLLLKNSIIEIASGAIIPLSILPQSLFAFLRFTPFYYVIYYPANLLLRAPEQDPLTGLLILGCWCVVILLLSQIWLKKAHRFYEGVGI